MLDILLVSLYDQDSWRVFEYNLDILLVCEYNQDSSLVWYFLIFLALRQVISLDEIFLVLELL